MNAFELFEPLNKKTSKILLLLVKGSKGATSSAVATTAAVAAAGPKRPALQREISKEDFDLDINNMQAELDNLKVRNN